MGGTTESELFTRLVDLGALLAFEHRLRWEELLGEPLFAADTAEATLHVEGAGSEGTVAIDTGLHLLGTAAPSPGTWLWSWGRPDELAAPVSQLARRLRAYGDEHGVPEFARPEIPLDGERTGRRIGIAAGLALRSPRTVFPAPVEGGTIAVLLVEDPRLALPAPTLARVTRVLEEGVATTELRSHSAALARYAQDRGIGLDWNGGAPELRLPDGRLTVRLDHERDRIAQLTGSAA